MSEDETGRRTLTRALQDGPVRTRDAIRIASATADAVSALHAAGRAHGHVGPDSVVLRPGGGATLLGSPLPKTGLAAPPDRRHDDLVGVGRVLAAALGWPPGLALPAPVGALVARAGTSDAPAAALADAIRRLDREPAALAPLLPEPGPTALIALLPDRLAATERPVGALAGVVPLADRRSTGFAAAALIAAATLGAALLLIGAPASPDAVRAAPAAPSSAAVAPPGADSAVVADAPTSPLEGVLRSLPARSLRPGRAIPRVPTPRPAARPAVAAPPRASAPPASVPTAAPRPSATAGPVPGPTAKPTPPTAPSAPAPAPSAAPTAAPTRPAPPSPPAPPRTTATPSPRPAAPSPVPSRSATR